MAHDEMAVAHSRDYADKRRLDDLRHLLEEFVERPPSRLSPHTDSLLRTSIAQLGSDADRIVRTWD